jgi:hypothetical protein
LPTVKAKVLIDSGPELEAEHGSFGFIAEGFYDELYGDAEGLDNHAPRNGMPLNLMCTGRQRCVSFLPEFVERSSMMMEERRSVAANQGWRKDIAARAKDLAALAANLVTENRFGGENGRDDNEAQASTVKVPKCSNPVCMVALGAAYDKDTQCCNRAHCNIKFCVSCCASDMLKNHQNVCSNKVKKSAAKSRNGKKSSEK